MPDDIQKVKSQSSIENPVDLDHHLPSAIKILGGRLGIHAVRFSASKYGMGLREWRIIHILGCDGPSTISEVAERLAMDQGGTSRSIAKLESRGMLVRRSDASDRRLSRVELSTAGQHTHNEIMKFSHAREKRLLSRLSKQEKRELDRMLMLISDEISAILEEKWDPIEPCQ